MNFLGLVQRLRQEAGAAGTGATTVINQSGELARMVNWINDAWLDIQSLKTDFDFMRATASFRTVAGEYNYPMSQIGVSNYVNWDTTTFRNYVNPTVTLSIGNPCQAYLAKHGLNNGDAVYFATSGALPTGIVADQKYFVLASIDADHFTFSASLNGAAIVSSGTQSGTHTMSSSNTSLFAGLKSEILMDCIDYDTWRDSYLLGANRQVQTRPFQVAMSPSRGVCLAPVPSAGYTVLADYYTQPAYMTNDTDAPINFPDQFHMAIVWKALMYYGQYEESAAVMQRGMTNFNSFKTRIMNTENDNAEFCGALC